MSLARRLSAEFLGTAFLLSIVVGSGIMAERLAGGNLAVALLCNSTATALGLFVLISVFKDVSGAHFNPAVSAVSAWGGSISRSDALAYIGAQLGGALLGVSVANGMFDVPLFSISRHARSDAGFFLSEVVATGGLLLVIRLGSRFKPSAIPAIVGAYIGSAYWFTSSTSFANPAVTVGRIFSDTFTGIAPADAPRFLLAQATAVIAAIIVERILRTQP